MVVWCKVCFATFVLAVSMVGRVLPISSGLCVSPQHLSVRVASIGGEPETSGVPDGGVGLVQACSCSIVLHVQEAIGYPHDQSNGNSA